MERASSLHETFSWKQGIVNLCNEEGTVLLRRPNNSKNVYTRKGTAKSSNDGSCAWKSFGSGGVWHGAEPKISAKKTRGKCGKKETVGVPVSGSEHTGN